MKKAFPHYICRICFPTGETHPPEGLTSQQIVSKWRDEAGEFPGTERTVFWGLNYGGGGQHFELWLQSSDVKQLDAVVDATKAQLATYAGVSDISDSRGLGRWELQLRLKPQAHATGIRLDEVARTVRAAYFGDEAMRLQRGRHEVRLLVDGGRLTARASASTLAHGGGPRRAGRRSSALRG